MTELERLKLIALAGEPKERVALVERLWREAIGYDAMAEDTA